MCLEGLLKSMKNNELWRFLSGGQGAPGSNPGIPTEQRKPTRQFRRVFFCF